MLRSTAVLATRTAHRDAEELLTLLQQEASVRTRVAQPPTTCLIFPFGVAAVLPESDGLMLIAAATDGMSLGLVEDVLAWCVTTLHQRPTDLDWQFASVDDRAIRLAAA